MNCGGIDPHNLYLWCVLCGLLAGGALSFTAAPKRRRNGTAAMILLSFAAVSALCGFIFAGIDAAAYRLPLYWLGGSFAAGWFLFYFWKATGAPLLFILVIAISLFYGALGGWMCASSAGAAGGEIGRLRIVSRSGGIDRIRWELEPGSDRRGSLKTGGGRLSICIEKIEVPYYFFLLPQDGVYRICGFTAGDPAGLSDDGTDAAASAGSVSAPAAAERILGLWLRLPGLGMTRFRTDGFTLVPNFEYGLYIESGLRPVIKRRFD